MATDLALDDGDNLTLGPDQQLLLTNDGDEVAQACKIALRAWLGEYFLDQRFGIDYLNKIFDKRANAAQREREIRRVLKEVQGVRSIKSITVTKPDFDTREMGCAIEIITDYSTETITL